jgi:1-acyl-sn-glycerol-3-phosphate acyltransferase
MFNSIYHVLLGTFAILGYFLNTLFWVIPVLVLSFLKLLPFKAWQTFVSYPLDACATNWITINNLNQRIFSRTKIKVSGLDGLSPKDWYLVISNHQSWVDILVLQRVFNRKIPFLKFFLKQELIWVPFLGVAWWALDFPFMRRYSKSYLAKNPHHKGKDMETTRKACEKFQSKPVSVMNFVEGTRFTQDKKRRQGAPFEYLLRPKAGGIAFVLSAMGEQLNKLVNVTIHYPDGVPTYWEFISGKVRNIDIRITVSSVSDLFESGVFDHSYFDNPQQRAKFHSWLNELWVEKDTQLKTMQHQ